MIQMQYSQNEVGALRFRSPSLFLADGPHNHPIAQAALDALFQELCAYPKPGLVSLIDSGSHQDMDASTFMTGMFSLRTYFQEIAFAGMGNAGFDELRRLGLEAELGMLKATKNINTHRGAIFTLGLLAAAAGFLINLGQSLEGPTLGDVVRERWGKEILRSAPPKPCSHGTLVASLYGVAGAREGASVGFPHVFNTGLPTLQESLLTGVNFRCAMVQAFFSLMAVLPDNNLLFRGGKEGLSYAQVAARTFLDKGGVYRKNWQECARHIHHEFVARRLSPGGSADLLAATLFVHRLQVTLRNGGLTNRSIPDADPIEHFIFSHSKTLGAGMDHQ
jgi:triphosphoribosyl-dephospho-CoA synthase